MGLPPAPSLNAFHIEAVTVGVFAIVLTLVRLGYRVYHKLTWWDDLVVALSAVFLAILLVGVWLATPVNNLKQSIAVTAYYLSTYAFTLSNYCARLSILIGILRIAPNQKTRRFLKFTAGGFVLICCVLLAQKIWVCDGNSEMARTWKLEKDPGCHLGLQVSITELVTDILTDGILVITPITFLAKSKLKASQKRRLYAIFGASLATTIVSIVQDWLIMATGGLREITASLVEVSVSVIVASLPVIVSMIWRLFRKEDDSSTGRFATNYEHTRRAKPSAWAGGRDLVSSSNEQKGTRTHITATSVAIQLSEIRHTDDSGLSPRDDKGGHFDDDVSFNGRQKAVDAESSEDLGRHSLDSAPVGKSDRKGDVDFTVSAISYGGGRRRDAEYDIDIVDDLDSGRPTINNPYIAYGYQPQDDQGRHLASPGAISPLTPDSEPPYSTRRDSYILPNSAPVLAPPQAALTTHTRQPSTGTSNIISTAVRRMPSFGGRLGRTERSEGTEGEKRERSRTKSSSRSRSESRPRGGESDVEAQTAAPSGPSRSFLPGFFRPTGVLVQQSVVVSSDPERLRAI